MGRSPNTGRMLEQHNGRKGPGLLPKVYELVFDQYKEPNYTEDLCFHEENGELDEIETEAISVYDGCYF